MGTDQLKFTYHNGTTRVINIDNQYFLGPGGTMNKVAIIEAKMLNTALSYGDRLWKAIGIREGKTIVTYVNKANKPYIKYNPRDVKNTQEVKKIKSLKKKFKGQKGTSFSLEVLKNTWVVEEDSTISKE